VTGRTFSTLFDLILWSAGQLGLVASGFVESAGGDTDVPQFAPNPVVFDQTATNDNLVVLMAAASQHNSGLTWLCNGHPIIQSTSGLIPDCNGLCQTCSMITLL
jgi:hypothetical protein